MCEKHLVTRARAVFTAALFIFVACASVAAAQEPLKIFGLTIPDRVAGLPHGKMHDFEKTNPGLGYSIPFQRSGWLIDVYLYDLRLTAISEDPGSTIVTREL